MLIVADLELRRCRLEPELFWDVLKTVADDASSVPRVSDVILDKAEFPERDISAKNTFYNVIVRDWRRGAVPLSDDDGCLTGRRNRGGCYFPMWSVVKWQPWQFLAFHEEALLRLKDFDHRGVFSYVSHAHDQIRPVGVCGRFPAGQYGGIHDQKSAFAFNERIDLQSGEGGQQNGENADYFGPSARTAFGTPNLALQIGLSLVCCCLGWAGIFCIVDSETWRGALMGCAQLFAFLISLIFLFDHPSSPFRYADPRFVFPYACIQSASQASSTLIMSATSQSRSVTTAALRGVGIAARISSEY
jgi:hypothetical protein